MNLDRKWLLLAVRRRASRPSPANTSDSLGNESAVDALSSVALSSVGKSSDRPVHGREGSGAAMLWSPGRVLWLQS